MKSVSATEVDLSTKDRQLVNSYHIVKFTTFVLYKSLNKKEKTTYQQTWPNLITKIHYLHISRKLIWKREPNETEGKERDAAQAAADRQWGCGKETNPSHTLEPADQG
ncbi:MAG: hypothetical protein Kow006_06820 [Gammaproteobacteria bacterium]